MFITDNTNYFMELAKALSIKYNAELLDCNSNFDSAYFDYLIDNQKITFHYHVMVGIEIFPFDSENITKEATQLTDEIGLYLISLLPKEQV
jgi:hypothetical protein